MGIMEKQMEATIIYLGDIIRGNGKENGNYPWPHERGLRNYKPV